ncbi:15543_t:CDS:2 [Funneliformis geosporum]|uniref:15543_t:CDS:1 n=1 Tax=Funneliformis geosporum TaxID=1117311 RepID=A0A9W4SRL2_9GLOM|nr:15543_t:CDS:2 [Funneliformis geosporum]
MAFNSIINQRGIDYKMNLTGKDFFYLDVSEPFNTQHLNWQDLTSINTVPAHIGAASVRGGANNESLFLYGGIYDTNKDEMSLVYEFDTRRNTWLPQVISGNAIRKDSLKGIVDYNGKMYLFGGHSKDGTHYNDMIILDTIKLNWEVGSLINAPSPRSVYGATLLSNQQIIYLGR